MISVNYAALSGLMSARYLLPRAYAPGLRFFRPFGPLVPFPQLEGGEECRVRPAESANHRLNRYSRSSSGLLDCGFKLRGTDLAGVLCEDSLLSCLADAAEFGIAE